MLKKINRILKLVGLNLVRAKRKSVKWQKILPADPATCAALAVPLADYMGDSEWHNAPGPEGRVGCCGVQKTHYVGDDCPGGHGGHRDLLGADDHKMTRVEQPNSDNKIGGPTS